MKTFLLIALLHGNTYVLDSHLTLEDCARSVQEGVTWIQVTDSLMVRADDSTVLLCEPE